MATVYDEGRTASMSREGVIVQRTLRVTPYADVPYVCDLILGGARIIGGFLLRLAPSRDPQFPWCIAKSIEIEGVGAYTGTAESGLNNLIVKASYGQGCRLKVTYETLSSTGDPRDPDEDILGPPPLPTGNPIEPTNQQEIDLASVSHDWSAEYLSEDGHSMGLFGSEAASTADWLVDGFITKRVPKLDLLMTREYVVRIPWSAVSRTVGTVNKSSITYGRVTWPKGTVRFDGLKSMRKLTSFGQKFWSLTYHFSIRPLYDSVKEGGKDYVGWQRKYRFKDGLWYWYKSRETNKLAYEWDEDNASQTLNAVVVSGLRLLFHPRAT